MKQYFSYFKILFIIVGVLAVITGVMALTHKGDEYVRQNFEAPTQRVYDYADKLTDEEEEKLEALIAKREGEIGCDLVIVTINESVLEKYGRTENTDSNWEFCMTSYADDFYDQNNFGYDKVHGDGALLLYNWYDDGAYGSEMGTHFSTCGRVLTHYTTEMVNTVLDDVYNNVHSDAYYAYKLFVEDVASEMNSHVKLPVFPLIIVALIIAGIFVVTHLKSKEGEKTTVSSTYVENGSVKFNVKRDELVNKYVTSRAIPKSSSSSGGSSGGAGGHTSSGGVSHGGGSRRG